MLFKNLNATITALDLQATITDLGGGVIWADYDKRRVAFRCISLKAPDLDQHSCITTMPANPNLCANILEKALSDTYQGFEMDGYLINPRRPWDEIMNVEFTFGSDQPQTRGGTLLWPLSSKDVPEKAKIKVLRRLIR